VSAASGAAGSTPSNVGANVGTSILSTADGAGIMPKSAVGANGAIGANGANGVGGPASLLGGVGDGRSGTASGPLTNRLYSLHAIYFRREAFKSTADCLTAAYAQQLPLGVCE